MAKRGKVKHLAIRDTEERVIKRRKYPHLFLIVCEDENTEPYYFSKFKEEFDKISGETVFLRFVGTGRSSKGVVEQAIIKKQELFEEANKTVDEVWAVFDKDDANKSDGNRQRFSDAFEVAKENAIKVAYSNEVFELWLLLHFVDIDSNTPISRQDIYSRLETNINKGRTDATQIRYNHKRVDTDIIDLILNSGNENEAIKRAKHLDNEHKKKGTQPIDANPNTKVYSLVEQLRELQSWYSRIP
ncbi:MAG: RloB family protein [Tannerella sp.]|jgi:hypothetical protein|nr:RloB family protein [Tannerella sp.]